MVFFQINFQGFRDRRRFRGRGGNLSLESGLFDGFHDRRTVRTQFDVSLSEIRKILIYGFHVSRVEEHEHVIAVQVDVLDVLRDGFHENSSIRSVIAGFEKSRDGIFSGERRGGQQEFVFLMLGADQSHDGSWGAVSEENLALAVDDVLLEIIRYDF